MVVHNAVRTRPRLSPLYWDNCFWGIRACNEMRCEFSVLWLILALLHTDAHSLLEFSEVDLLFCCCFFWWGAGSEFEVRFFLFHFRFQVRSLCSAFQGCTVKCLYDICIDILSFCFSRSVECEWVAVFFSRISSALRTVSTDKILRCINTLVIIIITWGLLIQANKQLSSTDIIRDRLSKTPSELSGFCSFGSFVLWSLKLSNCGSPRCNLNGWQRVNYEVTLSIPQT